MSMRSNQQDTSYGSFDSSLKALNRILLYALLKKLEVISVNFLCFILDTHERIRLAQSLRESGS